MGKQIPDDLYNDLCKFFLSARGELDDYELDELYNRIYSGLKRKQEAITARELYSQSKDKRASSEEREAARQAYLDHRGVPQSYRWHKGEEP